VLSTVVRALEHVVPSAAQAVVEELKSFMAHREVIGWVLLVTLLFSSSLGFKVLESAISVIFLHRVEKRKRHSWFRCCCPLAMLFSSHRAVLWHVFDCDVAGDRR